MGFGLSGARAADLANDDQKTLYAVGIAISQSMGAWHSVKPSSRS